MRQITNDYVYLTEQYCRNYKALAYAAKGLRQSAKEARRMMDLVVSVPTVRYGSELDSKAWNNDSLSTAFARRQYHADRAEKAEQEAEEIDNLLKRIDVGISLLEERERQIIRMLYIDKLPLPKITAELYMSKPTLWRTAKKAIGKLAVTIFGIRAQWKLALAH